MENAARLGSDSFSASDPQTKRWFHQQLRISALIQFKYLAICYSAALARRQTEQETPTSRSRFSRVC